ncbi:hypothetical protein SCHPADRAFT_898456 [Schizopora paradoxa]|uniref:Uncharacterized protein n=1 Tax=Schizopora paradoxa TaxID=27342 RepID=A0A0H2S6F7_9AGAM|nr:hypothetical protein SCHPADRAFT_898456 [Schizopora paradoxa]
MMRDSNESRLALMKRYKVPLVSYQMAIVLLSTICVCSEQEFVTSVGNVGSVNAIVNPAPADRRPARIDNHFTKPNGYASPRK